MAKVQIEAKAHVRKGIFKDEETRQAVLDAFGCNDKLLKEVKAAAKVGQGSLTRVRTLNDVETVITLTVNDTFGTVEIVARDAGTGAVVGTVIYGKTKFLSAVAEE